MNIRQDVCSLEDLRRDPARVIRQVRANNRPMVVATNGKPDVVIIPAAVMKDKLTALSAVCELADVS
jgi:prevent-host-death family protein